MAKTDFESIDEYLATLPKPTRGVLERVRAVIRKAVPTGEEAISYQIPALKLQGRVFIYFAGWKEHYSLYPATEKVALSLERELANYEVRKGTIRFPLSESVPVELITKIAKIRASETALLADERRAQRGRVSTSNAGNQAQVTKTKKAKTKTKTKKAKKAKTKKV